MERERKRKRVDGVNPIAVDVKLKLFNIFKVTCGYDEKLYNYSHTMAKKKRMRRICSLNWFRYFSYERRMLTLMYTVFDVCMK